MIQSILLGVSAACGCMLAGRILLHYFQLESYQFPGYFKTVRRNLHKAILPGLLMTVLSSAFTVICHEMIKPYHDSASSIFCCIAGALSFLLCGMAIGRKCAEKQAKKAFIYTSRIKRLYVVSVAVMTAILTILFYPVGQNDLFHLLAASVFPLFLPLWIALCGLIAWPIEKAISELYFRDAQHILRQREDLIRIGITGSWGKTSVKFILGTILEEKYHTLVTPASYNTPMGVTKVIRSRLEPAHRIFVSEMGARHVGDIREMCRLVHPQYGILTSVGPQHLDTFRTVERVAQTKYELIEALPAEGKSFFADDGGLCKDLYNKTKIDKHLTGLNPSSDELWAEEISYSPEGSSFVLCTGDKRIACSTSLLGELNIRNILLSASVALQLGLSMQQISRGIAKIKPIEHRLQLIRHPGGLNVIDDAFNSNINGANQAFQVLKQFPEKRIIVTPGMVELGEQEYAMNRDFGVKMAECCDAAVLVGKKRSEAIRTGMTEAGFPEEKIMVVSSLEEAAALLGKITKTGDTVLFENDLPDNYSES